MTFDEAEAMASRVLDIGMHAGQEAMNAVNRIIAPLSHNTREATFAYAISMAFILHKIEVAKAGSKVLCPEFGGLISDALKKFNEVNDPFKTAAKHMNDIREGR